jgi:hypothetical protein
VCTRGRPWPGPARGCPWNAERDSAAQEPPSEAPGALSHSRPARARPRRLGRRRRGPGGHCWRRARLPTLLRRRLAGGGRSLSGQLARDASHGGQHERGLVPGPVSVKDQNGAPEAQTPLRQTETLSAGNFNEERFERLTRAQSWLGGRLHPSRLRDNLQVTASICCGCSKGPRRPRASAYLSTSVRQYDGQS